MKDQPADNTDIVLHAATQLNLDLEKRLPLGAYTKIEEQTGFGREIVKSKLKEIRKICGINTKKVEGKRDKLKKDLIATGIDFSKRLKYGMSNKLAKRFGVAPHTILGAITSIHQDIKAEKAISIIKPPVIKESINLPKNTFVNYCVDNGLVRANPNAEIVACNKLSEYLLHKVPHGGAGMIIGTPTAFCASKNSNNNMFLTDNLKVAHVLDLTTEISPTLVIGSGVHPDQAELKKEHWKGNNTTHHFNVITDIVDRDSLTYYIVKLAEQHPFCKVVIMTSGHWIGCDKTKKKWGLDLNFKDPIEMLINKYPQLHVLVMTTGQGHHFQFKIRYFNNGNEIK